MIQQKDFMMMACSNRNPLYPGAWGAEKKEWENISFNFDKFFVDNMYQL